VSLRKEIEMDDDQLFRVLAVAALALVAPAGGVQAQQPAAGPIEEITVTGSFIRRQSQFDLPSPLEVITYEDIDALGANEIGDIIEGLTINTGSQNNPDAFTQNFSTGTSNVNLRGLGVSSTLVLINGRRQTQSAVATDRGENFVDTSSLPPLIAFDRIEVLKDGATSLYGSEAVAGVVNFLTRDAFEGFELDLSMQTVDAHPQDDLEISGLYGGGNDRTHVLVAFSYLDREPLSTYDRRLSGPTDDLSQAGNPGSFLVPSLPSNPLYAPIWTGAFDSNLNGVADAVEPQLGLPPVPGADLPVFADPDCAAIAAQDPKVVPAFAASIPTPAGDVPIGLCQFDFGGFYSLVPEEQRAAGYIQLSHAFSDRLGGELELHIADNEAERNNSPSFPFARFPTVPATHPDNPFGADVSFIGRVIGAGGVVSPSIHTSETWRFSASLDGDIGERWNFDVGATLSENDFFVGAEDVLIDGFGFAIQGLGGASCDPSTGTPGSGSCLYFNPFGTALTGTGTVNPAALIDDLIGNFSYDATSELMTLEGVVSGELGELAGGPVGLAIGAQERRDEIGYDYDENTNNDNFLFFNGTPDFAGDRDVSAVFVELALPLAAALDLQLAARYEDYGGGVDSADPKLSMLWRPSTSFSLRASYGTSFRAPSLFQEFGVQTTLTQLVDPNVGIPQFFPVRAEANPGGQRLEPEEADVVNLGFSWSITDRLELGIDYWSFDYSQVIIQQSPQALLNAAAAGDPAAQAQVIRDPASGLLLRVDSYYANASALETDGFDLAIVYDLDLGGTGTLSLGADATLITSYDLDDPQAGRVDGLGRRNFSNFATSTPELRATAFAAWQRDNHALNFFVRYIDSYIDDGAGDGRKIDSHVTLDAQYNFRWRADFGPILSFGAINLLDEDPPHVATNGGYDSKVHDPRGRLLYARASFEF
jgi:iron complex outermembrane receptor protein